MGFLVRGFEVVGGAAYEGAEVTDGVIIRN